MFLSILVIEAIILIPSYLNYERDLLTRLELEGRATIMTLFQMGHHADPKELKRGAVQVMEESRLLGGALYPVFGDPAILFGEVPVLRPNPPSESWVVRERSADGNVYEVYWPGTEFGNFYAVVVRLDASWIAGELAAFVVRILGLVLLISTFVTLVTMFIVGRLVIGPVLRLHQSAVAAAENPSRPDDYLVTGEQNDELGEVTRAFNRMLSDVASTQRQEIARVVAMTENSIAGNFAYDAAGRLVYCNRAALALCASDDPERLEQRGHPKVVVDESQDPVTFGEYLRQGPSTEELMLRVSADSTVPCLVSSNCLHGEGGAPSLYFASVLDVTEMHAYRDRLEKQNFELEAASHAKSQFLANMSHELRTPLNAIIGFSEVMTQQVFGPLGNDRYGHYAEDIHTSAVHLLSIIGDVLDLAKIEADKAELSEQQVDISDAIAACLRIVGARAEEGQVGLETEIAPGLPALYADERLIKQILLNLLSNAIKFTPEQGTVKIHAGLDGGGLRIVVRDTGIGMSEAEIEKALSPFGQVESALTRKHQGTGLGLPLVKSFVELHGGTLLVTSTKGAGTTVTVRFGAKRILQPGVERGDTGRPDVMQAG
ncbi:MAG: ATP-binding protein [Alphaproteobacteria bacterium]|nr:ATP-binding protein [Alphaproteobacteria bacterium]